MPGIQLILGPSLDSIFTNYINLQSMKLTVTALLGFSQNTKATVLSIKDNKQFNLLQ